MHSEQKTFRRVKVSFYGNQHFELFDFLACHETRRKLKLKKGRCWFKDIPPRSSVLLNSMMLQWTYLSPEHSEAERRCCITPALMKWGIIPLKWFLLCLSSLCRWSQVVQSWAPTGKMWAREKWRWAHRKTWSSKSSEHLPPALPSPPLSLSLSLPLPLSLFDIIFLHICLSEVQQESSPLYSLSSAPHPPPPDPSVLLLLWSSL